MRADKTDIGKTTKIFLKSLYPLGFNCLEIKRTESEVLKNIKLLGAIRNWKINYLMITSKEISQMTASFPTLRSKMRLKLY